MIRERRGMRRRLGNRTFQLGWCWWIRRERVQWAISEYGRRTESALDRLSAANLENAFLALFLRPLAERCSCLDMQQTLNWLSYESWWKVIALRKYNQTTSRCNRLPNSPVISHKMEHILEQSLGHFDRTQTIQNNQMRKWIRTRAADGRRYIWRRRAPSPSWRSPHHDPPSS